MSNAMIGYGARVFAGSDEIAECSNITPPNFETDDVDVTHMQSPNRTREFIAGLTDPGEASFEINWVPSSATDILLLGLKTSGATVTWKFQWPNGTYWEFPGYVKGFEPSAATEDKMTATITIRVGGDVTPSYI